VGGYENTPGQQDCGVDIDECSSNPCFNTAVCGDLIDMYSCACVAGYANGACSYSYISEYTAACTVTNSAASTQYDGNCDIDVNECASSPCANGATCHDSVDDAAIPVHTYQCVCLSGFANGA
jgi:hypothetical protein